MTSLITVIFGLAECPQRSPEALERARFCRGRRRASDANLSVHARDSLAVLDDDLAARSKVVNNNRTSPVETSAVQTDLAQAARTHGVRSSAQASRRVARTWIRIQLALVDHRPQAPRAPANHASDRQSLAATRPPSAGAGAPRHSRGMGTAMEGRLARSANDSTRTTSRVLR
jgi:hypothetical protein